MNTEALARDVHNIFGWLRHFMLGEGPPPAGDELYRAVAAIDIFQFDADLDFKMNRMSVVRMLKAMPPIEAGELIQLPYTEACRAAQEGLAEVVCAEAGSYKPEA